MQKSQQSQKVETIANWYWPKSDNLKSHAYSQCSVVRYAHKHTFRKVVSWKKVPRENSVGAENVRNVQLPKVSDATETGPQQRLDRL